MVMIVSMLLLVLVLARELVIVLVPPMELLL